MANVPITVPDGMTADQFQKLVATFVKSRQTGQVKGKAQAAAMKDLRTKYAQEYEDLVKKHSPAE